MQTLTEQGITVDYPAGLEAQAHTLAATVAQILPPIQARYALLVAIKARLRRVVGASVVAIVASGLVNARLRGLLGGPYVADEFSRRVFAWKMAVAAVLILVFLFALPALKLVRVGIWRGRLFNAVHVVVLVLGVLAAMGGILLAR
jgi:hypothetical protein